MQIQLRNGKVIEVKANGVRSAETYEPDRQQIELAKRYLRGRLESAKPVKRVSSYITKGLAERAEGGYIANGALIVAAYELGVPIFDPGYSPNLTLLLPKA